MDTLEELDVRDHCQSMKGRYGLWDEAVKEEEKVLLLESNRLGKVKKLIHLDCEDDPVWCQQLLDRLAPQLMEVQLQNVQLCHLLSLQNMPQLRRLEIEGWDDELEMNPYIFPPMTGSNEGLEFLRVSLPKETSLSLIWMHAHSLKEVELSVGLKLRMNSRLWTCKDLHERLAACGLRNLEGLLLRRGEEAEGFHPEQRCKAQLTSVSSKLPWVSVLCDKCCQIPW